MGDPGAGELVNIDTGGAYIRVRQRGSSQAPGPGTSGFTCESLHLENSR